MSLHNAAFLCLFFFPQQILSTCSNTFLTELTASQVVNLNQGLKVNEARDGEHYMVMGDDTNYTQFLGIHPEGDPNPDGGYVTYNLAGQYQKLTGVIGLAQTSHCYTNGDYGDTANGFDGFYFKFYIDNVETHTSANQVLSTDYEFLTLDVRDVNELKIEVHRRSSNACDHAVFANPILTCPYVGYAASVVGFPDWSAAEAHCVSQHCSHLASIHDAVENSIVNGICAGLEANSDCWIGSSADGSNWQWSDASDNSYSNWETGKGTPTSGRCAHYSPYAHSQWNSDTCVETEGNDNNPFSFVCNVGSCATSTPTTMSPTTATPTTQLPTTAQPTTISPSITPSLSPSKYPSLSPTYDPTAAPWITPTSTPTKEGEVGGTVTTRDSGRKFTELNKKSFFEENQNLFIMLIIVSCLTICLLCLGLLYWRKRNSSKQQDIKKAENEIELERVTPVSDHIPSSPIGITPLVSTNMQSEEQEIEINKDPYSNNNALRMWLDNMDLVQYYDMFIKQGFGDHMSALHKLNDEDLKDMGVSKIAHRKVILEQIKNNVEQIDIVQQGQFTQNEENNSVAAQNDAEDDGDELFTVAETATENRKNTPMGNEKSTTMGNDNEQTGNNNLLDVNNNSDHENDVMYKKGKTTTSGY